MMSIGGAVYSETGAIGINAVSIAPQSAKSQINFNNIFWMFVFGSLVVYVVETLFHNPVGAFRRKAVYTNGIIRARHKSSNLPYGGRRQSEVLHGNAML